MIDSSKLATSNTYDVIVSNSGDSRCIAGSTVTGTELYSHVTEDHKPTDDIERARITKASGIVSNGRVDGDLSVSRAIGDWQFKANPDIDLFEQKVSAEPDVYRYTIKKGDWVLMACDGIFERLNTDQVASFINEKLVECNNDPLPVTEALCDYSLRAGSKDNMTVVLAVLEDGTSYTPVQGEASWIPGEIFPEDSSFMNAYRQFAVDNGFESEVSSLPKTAGQEQAAQSPLLQLLAQLQQAEAQDEDEESSEMEEDD